MSYHQTPSRNWWLIISAVVLLAAAAFRLFALSDVPPGLAQDEILDADIASFILGGEHAFFFRHGYGHEPLYHYWSAPFQVVFGENVLSIRLPSVYLGMLLIALTMRWAKRDYGFYASLAAGIGLAVSWWPIIFSRIGIRPILEPVVIVLAMWFWPLKANIINRQTVTRAIIAGICLGLAIYSYTAARIILLMPALLLVGFCGQWLVARRKSSIERDRLEAIRTQMIVAGVVLVIGFIVYLPLGLTLRSDPTLQQRLDQLGGPITALQAGNFRPVWEATIATMGVFSFTGDPRWTYSVPDRPLFDPISAILFYIGLGLALWRWRRPEYLVLPIWLGVALLPSALSPDAPSTVRMIGALPIVYLLPGLSLEWLVVRIQQRQLIGRGTYYGRKVLLVSTIAGLIFFNGYRTIRDGFGSWPQHIETKNRYQSVYQAIARHWLKSGTNVAPVVADAFFEPIDADSLRRNIGRDSGARWIQSGALVSGAMIWPGGTHGEDEQVIYVPEYAPLNPSLMAIAGISTDPAFRSDESPSLAVYTIPRLSPDRFGPVSIENILVEGDNGDLLVLRGIIDLTAQDGSVQLATWWEILGLLPSDSAIFIHMLDSSGTIVAQFDGLDIAAGTATPGDVFVQRHDIPLPDGLPQGEYTLRMGIYRRENGQRLLFSDKRDTLEIASCALSEGKSLPACRLTGFK